MKLMQNHRGQVFLQRALGALLAIFVVLSSIVATEQQYGAKNALTEAGDPPAVADDIEFSIEDFALFLEEESESSEADVFRAVDGAASRVAWPSLVVVEKQANGSFRYLVNGKPQLFIGMGYNPIYRYLPDSQRAAYYERDFRMLCQAGVNHIIGWDSDKGYEQDKFDELTLDYAHKYGLGVLMPFYLPVDGDYEDEAFLRGLMIEAAAKIGRYKGHPALRMWGVGNEVLLEMESPGMRVSFMRFWVQLADVFHRLDPDHPVILRDFEDVYVPLIQAALEQNPAERPWLHYGMNVYSTRLESILRDWPSNGFDRPLFVTEFGAETDWLGSRSAGYAAMWRTIRAHSGFVLGGAPYTWTTAGPEPTDLKWGLLDGDSRPIDGTFEILAAQWSAENSGRGVCE